MNLYCDNKGCGQQGEHKLNKETDEVICDNCGKVIKSVTVFMKTQLKTFGQIRRNERKRTAFSVRCTKCQQEGQPILKKTEEGKAFPICFSCGVELELSAPFKQTIVEFLRTSRTG